MKRPVLTAFDDLEWHEHKAAIPAAFENVPLKFDSQEVRLDLSEASYHLIAKTLAQFMEAGSPPPKHARPTDRRDAAYYVRLRAWCTERGIKWDTLWSRDRRKVKQDFDEYESKH